MWKEWQSIWHYIASGDITQYQGLKSMTEKEFYNIFEIHEEKLEKLRQVHR